VRRFSVLNWEADPGRLKGQPNHQGQNQNNNKQQGKEK